MQGFAEGRVSDGEAGPGMFGSQAVANRLGEFICETMTAFDFGQNV